MQPNLASRFENVVPDAGGQAFRSVSRHDREPCMVTDMTTVLRTAFPGEETRYFSPMSIGRTPSDADKGATAILDGIKTTTSSTLWDYPDGRIPFVGGLSVLVDGQGHARAIVETRRIEIIPFGAVDEDFARAYGEGDRTLGWFRAEMGAWYREAAARRGEAFTDGTPIICEWIAVVRRL
jgi:uncharacterized protein YhfF